GAATEDTDSATSQGNDSPSESSDSSSSADGIATVLPTEAEEQEHAAEFSGDPIVVTEDDLVDYVGPPPFTSDKIYDQTPPEW
ncbi:hypothetical protein WJX84_002075, partial [Apatococcus fuscideae]